MSNIAIIVVGYNRPNSLSRTLYSLKQANYYGAEVPLIISLDNCGSDVVVKVAQEFGWPYGEKTIIEHPERLGLRKHILFCGCLTKKYDAIVLLEDDIYVSPVFFNYVRQTVEKYDKDDRIAGISLYTHLWNIGANRPFIPQCNGHDIYFLQYAQSWGQVWTKRMWLQFYSWYLKNDEEFGEDLELPSYIVSWPKSSWLKYYIRYIVKTNCYFVYPYVALSTNFTEPGMHNLVSSSSFQVPLLWQEKEVYRLPDFDDSLHYDVYYEMQGLGRVLGLSENELCVDLYGIKGNRAGKRYWLTTKISEYKVISSYALQLRPHEINIIANIKGSEIFLYDTQLNETSSQLNQAKDLKALQIRYDVREISLRQLYYLMKYEIKQLIKRKLTKYVSFVSRQQ